MCNIYIYIYIYDYFNNLNENGNMTKMNIMAGMETRTNKYIYTHILSYSIEKV